MGALRAVFLNCTLKRSPEPSNTRALIDKVVEQFDLLGVESDIIRVVDHHVGFGVETRVADPADEWPALLERVLAADIVIVASPIWFGVRSSVAQLVMERLDGTYRDGDETTGQYPLYGKVGGVIVTGNEDGAHDVAATTLFNLSHLGCTIPANADSYWVGPAGPGPSYLQARGERHLYTNRTARYMAYNLAYLAGLLRDNPYPTDLNRLDAEARAISDGIDGRDVRRTQS